jgi:hypothetical protein
MILPNWWWRRLEEAQQQNKAFRLQQRSVHHRELIRGAWFYELERRVTGKYRFKKPYHKLTLKQYEKIRRLWPVDFEQRRGVGALIVTSRPSTQQWSEPVSLNLLRNDRSIIEAIKAFLKRERGRLSIKQPPKTPQRGERRQKYSWRMIEVFDLDRPLNDSERKLKSQAKQRYSDWAEG